MSEFNDFRVVLTRNIAQGTWDVSLENPQAGLIPGPKGSIQLNFKHDELVRLRDRHNWPNEAELVAIGKSVWQSLMTAQLEAAFFSGLELSKLAKRGMRLVISVVGNDSQPATPETIRLQELPLEALYFDGPNFLAPNPATPISRSVNGTPDRDPYPLKLPLHVLVVVATPTDKPKANMQDEKDAIQTALKSLIDSNAVQLEFCDPPTRSELATRLQKGFHVLHFVGHGAFEIVGDDPSPRAHLCLEQPTPERESDPVDAKTFDLMLQNSGIQLVVITACASAAPSPDEVERTIGPFDGVAQTLMAGVSGANAVVAMQFDLESAAAVTFSQTFYTQLLGSGRKLDEVVALCRKALSTKLNIGHRAWVTPVVYWRSRDGKVFEIDFTTGKLDPQVEKELIELDTTIKVHLKNIAESKLLLPDEQARKAAEPLIELWRQTIEDAQLRRGQLLGETLRLYGGRLKPGASISCRLTCRLRTPAQMGNISARVRYPDGKVAFSGAASGAGTQANAPFIQNASAGAFTLLLQNASQGVQWTPDEYELALLDFKVLDVVTDPFIEISLSEVHVEKDGTDLSWETLNAMLFVS